MNEVGVVIRVRNGAAYLEESIASVLAQSWPPAEVIVVEGGSTDGSIELLEQFGGRVRIVPQRRRGLAGAAQDGVDAAACPVIAFQDADDVWPRNRLAQMVGHLEAHPEWDGVMGRVEHFLSPDLTEEERRAFAVPV
ncbi:MAG: glycosyltransferase family A protein, partial [Chthoniobacterales bacterium]